MSDETFALTLQALPPNEADYDAIHDAVMESGRGRWFLQEYARRNRNADTRLLLAAIGRIEAVMLGGRAAPSAEQPDFAGLREAITEAKANLAAIKPDGAGGGKAGEFADVATALMSALARIRTATEHVQDVSWSLRDDRPSDRRCGVLDQNAAEIVQACGLLDVAQGQAYVLASLLSEIETRLGMEPAARATGPASAANSVAAAPAPDAQAMHAAPEAKDDTAQHVAEPQLVADAQHVVEVEPFVEPQHVAEDMVLPAEAVNESVFDDILGPIPGETQPPVETATADLAPQGIAATTSARDIVILETERPETLIDALRDDHEMPEAAADQAIEPGAQADIPAAVQPVRAAAPTQPSWLSALAPPLIQNEDADAGAVTFSPEAFDPAADIMIFETPAAAEVLDEQNNAPQPAVTSDAPDISETAAQHVPYTPPQDVAFKTPPAAVADDASLAAMSEPVDAEPASAPAETGAPSFEIAPQLINPAQAAQTEGELAATARIDAGPAANPVPANGSVALSEPGSAATPASVNYEAGPADFLLEPWPRVATMPAGDIAQAHAEPDAPVAEQAPTAPDLPDTETTRIDAVVARVAPRSVPLFAPVARVNDPLAPIIGLSEEEKIALFS